jgi:hypothetical protein
LQIRGNSHPENRGWQQVAAFSEKAGKSAIKPSLNGVLLRPAR